MDRTKEFILQCKKATEIQRVYFNDIEFEQRSQHEVGDYLTHETHTGSGEYITPYIFKLDIYGNNRSAEIYDIWLPRQDQLQEMLRGKYDIRTMCWDFNGFLGGRRAGYSMKFNSMEQLWLAFVMLEKYNKIWNGMDWEINNA